MTLPMSLRLFKTEIQYQKDRQKGNTRDLLDEPILTQYKYFRLIDNRYPYDAIFQVHHMLIPNRLVGASDKFTREEKTELEELRKTLFTKYSTVIENYIARTNTALWHIHLGKYYNERQPWLNEQPRTYKLA